MTSVINLRTQEFEATMRFSRQKSPLFQSAVAVSLGLLLLLSGQQAVASSWVASEDNVQQNWEWWFTGQSHWTNQPDNVIRLPGITNIIAVHYYEPCPEASYRLENDKVRFSNLPSRCAVRSIDYTSAANGIAVAKPSKTARQTKLPLKLPAQGSRQSFAYTGNSRKKIENTHGTPLDIGQGDFAISFKLKTTVSDLKGSCTIDNVNNGNMIFDRDRLHQDGSSIEVSILNGAIAARLDNIALCGSQKVTDNNWHEVRVERSGNRALISIDGKIDVERRIEVRDIRCKQPTKAGDCDIALYHEKWLFESAHHFYGDIKELQIFNNGKQVYQD